MTRLDVSIKLNRPQLKAARAVGNRRTVAALFGRGIGKSFLLRRIWYSYIAQWEHKIRWSSDEQIRGVRIIPIMPTLKQYSDVHGPELINELGPGGKFAWMGAKINGTTWQVTFPGGSWIKPFPASAYNSKTARGMRCDIIAADEIDDIDAGVYDSVAVPWLSANWSLGIELPFGTPTRGRHGLWYRFLQSGKLGEKLRKGEVSEADALKLDVAQVVIDVLRGIEDDSDKSQGALEQRALDVIRGQYAFHATYRDAPETVNPMAVARARAHTPESTFKREWEADPDAGEGLIYPFQESFHVRQPPPLQTFREFHVGMDHGWVDAGVLLLIGIQGHGQDATAWLLDEWYETECPNHVWDKRAKDWAEKYHPTFWPDPSRPDRINTLRQLGCNVQTVDNNIHGGISRVADMLFRRKSEHGESHDWARLYVAPKCKNTIREFGLYRRKKLPDGTFSEEPQDANNHTMDAGRYGLVGRFGLGLSSRNVVSGR